MFYEFVKIIARAAIKFYCRDLRINKTALLNCDGPLMLAVNHPNSFLDAVILCTIFDKPVYSLARGDAFNGKLISNILLSLKLLPVYRVSEGVENLEENYKTFEQCKEIFKQNGVVLIFSEGKCTITSLPLKLPFQVILVIYPGTTTCFNCTHKIGYAGSNRHSK